MDEFTSEPDLFSVRIEGALTALGLLLIAIGAYKAFKKLENEIERRKSTEDRVVQFNEVLRLLNTTLRHDLLNDVTVAMNSIDVYEDTG